MRLVLGAYPFPVPEAVGHTVSQYRTPHRELWAYCIPVPDIAYDAAYHRHLLCALGDTQYNACTVDVVPFGVTGKGARVILVQLY
eukprot:2402891-Rhodomonas_salina.3